MCSLYSPKQSHRFLCFCRNFALFKLFFVTFYFSMSEAEENNQVQCEKINFLNEFKTCFMNGSTKIGSQGFLISSAEDRDMKLLHIGNNKNVFFLPENVDEKYPNLEAIRAMGCSIKSIPKGVCGNLVLLKRLQLRNNQIEEIEIETFRNLKSLEELNLGEYSKMRWRNFAAFI